MMRTIPVPAPTGADILQVNDLVVHFPVPGGGGARGARGRRRELRRAPRRELRHRRGIRFGQIDHGAGDHAPRPSQIRAGRPGRHGSPRPLGRPASAGAAPYPDGVPGPVRVARSPPQRGRPRGRAAAAARRAVAQAGGGAARRAVRRGGPARRSPDPVPAPVLGRATPAPVHRPGAGDRARHHRLRRGRLGPRRRDPGADPQPPGEAPGRARPRLHLHRARSRRGAAPLRRGRGDVSRTHRRAGADADVLLRTTPSLQLVADLGGGAGRSCTGRPQGPLPRARRAAEPDRSAARLPVRRALSVRRRAVPGRGSTPCSPRARANTSPVTASRDRVEAPNFDPAQAA